MWRNYLKIAWRNITRSRGYAFINIVGLAVGMAASILILIWVQFETSVDRFHEHSDRIYAIWRNSTMQGEINTWDYTPAPYAPTMKEQFPEVEEVARISEWDKQLLTHDENNFYEQVTFTDPGFFRIFSFKAVEGDPVAALSEPGNIVLTVSVAKKLFGNSPAIGRSVTLAKQLDFEVKAIVEDLPVNTDFPFTAFLPFKKLEAMGWADDYWQNNSYRTFTLLSEGVDLDSFNEKFSDFTETNSEVEHISDFLFPVEDLHLYSKFENGKSVGGKIELIRMFAIVSIIVLVLAAINFVNLSTAQSEKRSKEVGIRKISGAGRGMLIGQFLVESTLIAFSAYLLAIVIVSFTFEIFKDFVGLSLENPFAEPYFWGISALYVFVIGILAGAYPAFLLSSFKPTAIFKSNMGSKGSFGLKPREILVVFQFAVVVTLISCVWIIQDQVRFVQNRDLGIDKENLIFHPVTESMRKNKVALRNELLALPEVVEVSYTFSPLTDIYSDTDGMEWQGKDPDYRPSIRRMGADANLVKTAGMELIAGRDIDVYAFPNDSLAAILNERTVKMMGFEEPIGQVIKDDAYYFTVVGVVKDFIMESPFEDVVPIMVTGPKRNLNFIHIRFADTGANMQALGSVEAIISKFNPDSPFEYSFVDQEHARKFVSQERIGKLTSLFSGLAIFISCMGLFGLATFIAERRRKEISVRKVLGASTVSVVALISSEFTKLVLISVLVGIPSTWYFMSDWLDSFAYRVSIDWTLFLWTGGITLLIALFTVSAQAIRAALVNPAEILKNE
ncbi:ABC-type antimicrobial peptide transport system, permease component [Algoriphagus faecimaris]|uniref:ABC-type antimicrobial peptide transport system, permease component n=1 Tax=Algoriphagus faecimaris TaxID=686796 RepID=A0A1G6ND51_9BACT|nr:ABC transporter permease [Algoriphagus faecimaris]SDC65692.1 ABC-type antimicrobial peptide transport system, permease component [Algoriphagus faecimaris]